MIMLVPRSRHMKVRKTSVAAPPSNVFFKPFVLRMLTASSFFKNLMMTPPALPPKP